MVAKIQIKDHSEIKGAEGLMVNIDYVDTDLKTAVIHQLGKTTGFLRVILAQAKLLGVEQEYIDKCLSGLA